MTVSGAARERPGRRDSRERTTLDHAQASELFSGYWEKELSPAETRKLEEHLGSCLVCRREYQRFQQGVAGLRALPRADAPPDFVAHVVRRVQTRSGGRFFTPRRLVDRVPYELFSLVMLAVILAIYLVLQLSQPGSLRLP